MGNVRFWRRIQGVYYGWRMVAVGIPLIMLLHGLTKRSYGLFFEPLQSEFGWSAAVIAFVFSLDRLEGGLLAPMAGYMNDRLGGRRVMLIGITIIGMGLILASQIHSLWHFYAVFLIVNVGASFASIMTMHALMVRWFDRHLGRAMGVMETSTAFATLIVPVMAGLITGFGWRTALAMGGATVMSVCLPIALLIRSRPEDYGLLPDGATTGDSSQDRRSTSDRSRSSSRVTEAASIGQALRLPAFWLIAISLGVFGLGQNAQRLLLIPHLQARGFSRELASATVAINGLAIGVPVKILMGFSSDRVNVKRVYPLVFLLAALALFILANVTQLWHVMVFYLIYEIAFSANLIFQAKLIVQFFGINRYATIRGLMHSVSNLVAVAGPVFGGAMFDATGSYRPFFMIMSGAVLVGIPFIMLAKQASWAEQQEPAARPMKPR